MIKNQWRITAIADCNLAEIQIVPADRNSCDVHSSGSSPWSEADFEGGCEAAAGGIEGTGDADTAGYSWNPDFGLN